MAGPPLSDVDPEAVVREAVRQVVEVHQAVLASLKPAAVSQDELRKQFEAARYTEGGLEAFIAQHGEEESLRQGDLAMVRAESRRLKKP